jgi:hypothetical protein
VASAARRPGRPLLLLLLLTCNLTACKTCRLYEHEALCELPGVSFSNRKVCWLLALISSLKRVFEAE